VKHDRDSKTGLASHSLNAVVGNALEAAPVLQNGTITVAESGAIVVEYIINVCGGGRLAVRPEEAKCTENLYQILFANSDVLPCYGDSVNRWIRD